MLHNDFILQDRLYKIKQIYNEYDLENSSYIAFSGGKDSTVLHYLFDMAVPNNKVPRVYCNTGIEYNFIVKFVKQMQENDDRIVILPPSHNIKAVLEENGYPFKSKEHSRFVYQYQKYGRTDSVMKYTGEIESKIKKPCPYNLLYQFEQDFKMKISDKCCDFFKKDLSIDYSKKNNRPIVITGMRKSEGGRRAFLNCLLFDKKEKLKKFHPLSIVEDEWISWFIEKYNIKLCELYYPPYNFDRTGCRGCPYALDLEKNLKQLRKYSPNEFKACYELWKPIYDEYKRIGFRLKEVSF